VERERRKEKKAMKEESLRRNRKVGKMEGMKELMTGLNHILFL
jgi:hypothetical protein